MVESKSKLLWNQWCWVVWIKPSPLLMLQCLVLIAPFPKERKWSLLCFDFKWATPAHCLCINLAWIALSKFKTKGSFPQNRFESFWFGFFKEAITASFVALLWRLNPFFFYYDITAFLLRDPRLSLIPRKMKLFFLNPRIFNSEGFSQCFLNPLEWVKEFPISRKIKKRKQTQKLFGNRTRNERKCSKSFFWVINSPTMRKCCSSKPGKIQKDLQTTKGSVPKKQKSKKGKWAA